MPGNDGGGPVSEGVRLLETMTYPEVGECIEANVPPLLPVGAVEQHGPHLPLGTDGLIENSWTLLEAVEQAIEPYTATHRALLVHWWDQVGPADVRRIFGDDFPGWEADHASTTETMLEYLRPDLVRADRKADGGATRVISYDVFPPSSDILWPNGIGNSALPASAELGKQLVELLVERIGRILDDEFPDG